MAGGDNIVEATWSSVSGILQLVTHLHLNILVNTHAQVVRTQAHTHTHTHTHMDVCVYVQTCTPHTHTHTYTRTACTHMNTCMHTFLYLQKQNKKRTTNPLKKCFYTHTHTHTHTHTQLCKVSNKKFTP